MISRSSASAWPYLPTLLEFQELFKAGFVAVRADENEIQMLRIENGLRHSAHFGGGNRACPAYGVAWLAERTAQQFLHAVEARELLGCFEPHHKAADHVVFRFRELGRTHQLLREHGALL